MNSAVKLIIGIIVVLAGLYWYAADFIGTNVWSGVIGSSAIGAFKTVFVGLFGLFLIFVGLIVAWIEYEDIRWQRREKQSKKK
ncbi:MAG: hypothetical protein HYW25_01465 [Candidatus Aenigmarchaeota archaeon]|nr:hypothetical protein [Candidatus Aenigmarchaeota archaeon]